MLVPNFQPSEHSKKSAPKWMDVDAINKNVNAEKKGIEDSIQKNADLVQSHQEHVISYSCPKCQKVFGVDSRKLVAQANLMRAKLQKEGDWRCPECKGELSPYKTIPVLHSVDNRYADLQEKRVDLEVEAGYNTTVDRLLVNKTLDALVKHANKNGMTLPIANYLKATRKANASDNTLDSFNSIDCELKWRYGRNQLARVEASVGIDLAGNFEMPRIFKYAGQEFPFEKKYIQQVEKEIRQKDLSRAPKKSDWLNVRKPDVTRFRGATASLTSEAMSPLVQPTAPAAPLTNNQPMQYQPNQQIVNPADGKTYQVVNQDQNTGMTVTDPMTGQQSIIPKDQVQNVKPAVQTQASLVDELVADELKKKAFSVTAVIDELMGGIGFPEGLPTSEVAMESPMESLDGISDNIAPESVMPHVSTMSQKWVDRRKELQAEKEAKRVIASTPVSRKSFQDQTIERLTKEGYKGFKPLSAEPTESGRSENGVPVGESGEIEIGMTDFPDYTKPFQEAQAEMVADREHFTNEKKLTVRHMQRGELTEYLDGKRDGDKDKTNYGLSETKEFENPKLQFESAQEIAKSLAKEATEFAEGENEYPFFIEAVSGNGLNDYLGEDLESILGSSDAHDVGMGEESWQWFYATEEEARQNMSRVSAAGIIENENVQLMHQITPEESIRLASKTAAEEAIDKELGTDIDKTVPVVEKPVVYKETKTAPHLEGVTEPATIEQSEGKGKEAITKLRMAQKELKTLQEEMGAKLKPFQEALADKSKEYAGPMKTKVDAVTTYVNMAFDQLSLLEQSTVAYEKEIYAAIQRSKAEAGKASLAEILKKAEEIAPQVVEEINKIKAMIENDRTTEVIEKYLYNYPQSKSHEKKVKTSSDESMEIDSLIKGWVEIIKSLLTLNSLMIA